jgi:thioredoxin 1
MANLTAVTDTTFEQEIEKHDGLAVVDFWAAWCGPCRQFAPVFERVSDRNEDIVFAKVDTEAEPEVAQMYGITSIPTLVVYRDGIPVFGQPGALPEPALEDIVRQVRALDMDVVREQYEEQLKAYEQREHQQREHQQREHQRREHQH